LQFKWAIAFDRRGVGDVITEMFCGRTCSDTFAKALADGLNETNATAMQNPDRVNWLTPLRYKPDDTGSFTDTANYTRLIPECTNVSVGYEHEHGPDEILDTWHLKTLRSTTIKLFKAGIELPVERGVNDVDEVESYGYGWMRLADKDFGVDFVLDPRDADDVLSYSMRDLVDWVRKAPPEDVADLLLQIAEDAVWAKEKMVEVGLL
jgi:hypothetical protein